MLAGGDTQLGEIGGIPRSVTLAAAVPGAVVQASIEFVYENRDFTLTVKDCRVVISPSLATMATLLLVSVGVVALSTHDNRRARDCGGRKGQRVGSECARFARQEVLAT